MNSAANAKAPSYGELWAEQGGLVVDFVPPMDGAPGWFLIAPTGDQAEAQELAWGPEGIVIAGADSVWDGAANTRALLDSGKDCPAAHWVAGLEIGGHKDFYIPSTREQRLLWARVPQLFAPRWYWSSTQYSADYAWLQGFNNGGQYGYGKGFRARVRAVRRFLIR